MLGSSSSTPFGSQWWQRASHSRKVLFLVILLCSLSGAWPTGKAIFQAPRAPATLAMTVDADRIIAGIEAHPHLWDTRVWWTGPWAQGPEFPYYRPLSSFIWWAQYKTFGPNSRGAFLAIHLVWYFVLLWVAFGLWSELIGRRLAALGLSLWAMAVPTALLGWSSPSVALSLWIDDPEITHGIAVILALWCVLRATRAAHEGQARLFFAGAALWFLVGLSFKESAYVFPLLAPFLLWNAGQLRRRWSVVAGFFVLAALAYAYRTWALGGPGYRYDTNGAWLSRWWTECVGGLPGTTMLSDAVPTAIALLVLWGYFAWRRLRWNSAFCLVLAIAALSWAALRQYDEPVQVVWRFLDSDLRGAYFLALQALLWLGLWSFFIMRRDRAQILAYGWVLLVYAPLLLRAGTSHILFFPSLGWGLWLAVPARETMRFLAQWRSTRR